MKTKFHITLLLVTIVLAASVLSQNSSSYKDFERITERFSNLKDAEEFDAALTLLDSIASMFPDKDFEVSDNTASIYMDKKEYDKAYKIWETGHSKGYFYLLHPRVPAYADIKETPEFLKLYEKDAVLRANALEISKSIKKVILPNNYNKNKSYPLLIVLHGGGSSIPRSESNWISEKLKNDFIVMYIQSYRYYNLTKFGWRNGEERTHKDIRLLFNELLSEYNVDTNRVIIGGISAGGVMAVDIAVFDIIPLAGVFGVCPAEPKALNDSTSTLLAERNLKVYIIAGETDFFRERQDNMMKIFDKNSVVYEFHEVKGLGHDYPENFNEWIDKAMDYLL